MITIALRFWFIADRTWTWNAYLAIFLAIVSFVFTAFYLPDSPRFLYSRKRFEESEKVMDKIYAINKG